MSAPDPEFVAMLDMLARALDRTFNQDTHGADRQTGFVLLVFDFNDGEHVSYVSNTQRADVLKAMKTFIDYNESLH